MANVHKDFHGCFSFGLKFLTANYGRDETEAYLRRTACHVYAPLIEALRLRGLPALQDHWNNIMTLEDAEFDLHFENDDTLALEVRKCPAIHHMREFKYDVCDGFCESTRIVNDEICAQAGYVAETEYDQAAGRCVQRFRKGGAE